jgi:proteasome lid subunit RPN8/RPN11
MSDLSTGTDADPVKPLEIPSGVVDQMIAHCRGAAPLECCGVLGGVGHRVATLHPLRNLAASETRFNADPKDLVEAWRSLREQKREILAIYHSHPRWEAVPSAVDRRENHWDSMPQIIVSLLRDPPEVRAWRLYEDTQRELPWTLIAPASEPGAALQSPPAGDYTDSSDCEPN